MKLNCNSFFDGEFKEVNLNSYLFYYSILNKYKSKDFSKPEIQQYFIKKIGYNSYGGYGENRKNIFKGTYLDKNKNYIHLGIDINVKAGTKIKCPFDAQVVDIFVDEDIGIGWGGRLILGKNKSFTFRDFKFPLLVLAHLKPEKLPIKTFIKKGEILGEVGTWPTNGNVFEHLHIQCINHCHYRNFDGYGKKEDLKNNPNPFKVEL